MDHSPPPFFHRGPAPLVRLAFFASLSLALLVLDARFRYAETLRTAIAALAYPLQALATAPVQLAELERAKRFAVGANAIRRESAGAIMADLADAWLFGESLAEIARYESDVMAVTAAEIQAVARASFDPARRVEVVIRGTGRAV